MTLRNIRFPVENQLHALHHFRDIPNDYLRWLADESGKGLDYVLESAKLPGSRFHPEFASHPSSLFEKLCSFEHLAEASAHHDPQKYRLAFRFSSDSFPLGIGFEGLVHTDQLSDEERKTLRNSERNGYKIRTARTLRNFPTWELHAIIAKHPFPTLITVFPGKYAPPFPDPLRQTKEFLEHCRAFWSEMVFIQD